MSGQTQGNAKPGASIRPRPSLGKSKSFRPPRKSRPLDVASADRPRKSGNKLLDSIKDFVNDAQKQADLTPKLTIQSFIERSRSNEIL